jgi:hypothetical protein
MKIKKEKKTLSELMTIMVDAELEPYNLTHKDVKDIKNWYTKYTFNSFNEYNSWKEFCIYLLRNHCTKKIGKSEALNLFYWVDLMYGLRNNYKQTNLIKMKKTTKKGGKGTKANGTKYKTTPTTRATANRVTVSKVKNPNGTTKRVTNTGLVLPKGIYMHNRNMAKPSYRAMASLNNVQRYVGTFKTISSAVKALNKFKKANRIK